MKNLLRKINPFGYLVFLLAKKVYPAVKEQGAFGVNLYLNKLAREKAFFRLLFALDRRFLGLTSFIAYCATKDGEIAKKGLAQVSREMLDYFNLEVKAVLPSETIFRKGTLLVGLNHEAFFEPIILAAILKNNHLRFIGARAFAYYGKNLNKSILTVMPRLYASDRAKRFYKPLRKSLHIFLDFYLLEKHSQADIGRINAQALKNAVDFLAKGQTVAIFPGGGSDVSSPWYPGIGRLLTLLVEKQTTEIDLVPMYFHNFSFSHLLRAIRARMLNRPWRLSGEVIFGDAVPLKTVLAKLTSAKITEPLASSNFLKKILLQKIRLPRV